MIDAADQGSSDPRFLDVRKDALLWIVERVDGIEVLDAGSDRKVFQILINNLDKKSEYLSRDELISAQTSQEDASSKIFDTIILSDSVSENFPNTIASWITSKLKPAGRLLILQKVQDVSSMNVPLDVDSRHLSIQFLKTGFKLIDLNIIGNRAEMPYDWLCVSLDKPDSLIGETTGTPSVDDVVLYSTKIMNHVEDIYLAEKKDIDWIKSEYSRILHHTSESLNNLQSRNKNILGLRVSLESDQNQSSASYAIDIDEKEKNNPEPYDRALEEMKWKYETTSLKLRECISILETEMAEEDRLIRKVSDLSTKLVGVENRYRMLANSRPGKLTLLYWKFLKNSK